jgi:hypothetical protein
MVELNSVKYPFLSTFDLPETVSNYLSNLCDKIVPLAKPTSVILVLPVMDPSIVEIVPSKFGFT